eukprot:5898794-Karenia_brevis.AAC.1
MRQRNLRQKNTLERSVSSRAENFFKRGLLLRKAGSIKRYLNMIPTLVRCGEQSDVLNQFRLRRRLQPRAVSVRNAHHPRITPWEENGPVMVVEISSTMAEPLAEPAAGLMPTRPSLKKPHVRITF